MRYRLERRARGFYVAVDVPRSLYVAVGKRTLVKSLKTSDPALAALRLNAEGDRLKALIDAKRHKQDADAVIAEAARQGGDVAKLLTDAADWRTNEAARVGAAWGSEIARHADTRAFVAVSEIDSTADLIARYHGATVAADYRGIATGMATPLTAHVASYLAQGGSKGPFTAQTAEGYRVHLSRAFDWLASQDVRTVEGVTSKLAGRYVQERLIAGNGHPGTIAKHLDALRGYWNWLAQWAGFEGVNPWYGKRPPKRNARHGKAEANRPFTDAEVSRLLTGGAAPDMQDAMTIAALSALRLEEIYQLTIADCAGGMFDIRQAKSPAGVRLVPIHSRLAETVGRLCMGKKAHDYMMPAVGDAERRSHSMSDRFIKYRRSLGIEDLRSGGRSRVNFHSFRRWTTTAMLQAGIAPHVVDEITGHELQGQTLGVYYGGATAEQLRAAVESVRLPEAV
jgi:integrase